MKQALRIALIYLVLSAAWIYFSDRAVDVLAATPAQALRLQTLKGWGFVAVSALVIGFLVWREVALLRQVETRYRSLVENAPDAIFVNREDRLTLVNRECLHLFGADTPEDLLGKSPFDLFHPEDHEQIRERIRIMRETGEAVPQAEERIVRLDRTVVPVAVRAAPFPFDGVNAIHVILRDITEQKAADAEIRALNEDLARRVEERTAELAARNRELETFTYSVSHDLKAPLRGLEGYSRLLLEDHSHHLDEEGRVFAGNIRSAALQMNRLIEDLLEYSRLERRDLHLEAVELLPLVERLLDERGRELEARGVEVMVESPPLRVRADETGLTLVFRNLLDNALKFTREVPGPKLIIRGADSDGLARIEVRDNGIGFDMRFHDRIFHLFERLHRAEEYDGTGIGLAMVHKAMERMGGRVWAESGVERGASFFLEMELEMEP